MQDRPPTSYALSISSLTPFLTPPTFPAPPPPSLPSCVLPSGINTWLQLTTHQPHHTRVPSSHITTDQQQLKAGWGSSECGYTIVYLCRQISVSLQRREEDRPWQPPSRGRPPSAPPATRRCTSSTSSPPTTASTTRPASAATTARAPSSLPTTTPSRECSTAGLTSTSCSRGPGVWTRASKELQRLSSQKETLGMRMLLKSQAPLLAPERNVLDAARQSIQLRGLLSTTLCITRAASSAAMEDAPSALLTTLRTRGSSTASTTTFS